MPPSRYAAVDDVERLKFVLVKLLAQPGDLAITATGDTQYKGGLLFKALTYAELTQFKRDVLGLSELDIATLTVPPDNPTKNPVPLPVGLKRGPMAICTFYHR